MNYGREYAVSLQGKKKSELVNGWAKESRKKKPYLSNSEDATMSLTVCCETVCVKEMGDLQEVYAVGRKGLSFKNKKKNNTKQNSSQVKTPQTLVSLPN